MGQFRKEKRSLVKAKNCEILYRENYYNIGTNYKNTLKAVKRPVLVEVMNV